MIAMQRMGTFGLAALRSAVAAAALTAALPAAAGTVIPPGKWSFTFTDVKGQADRPIRVFTYRPRQCDTKCPIVIVMHGMNRKASNARDNWELAADRYGLLVVAPEFSDKFWTGSRYYNLGAVAEEGNREKWAYSAIEHLFDEVRDDQRSYDLFGHSAGAQFAHRLLILLPDSRASVVMAANAGWYMMPEWRKDKAGHPYPHSLAGSPVGERELRAALQRKLHVLLGEEDTDPQHRSLDNSAASEAQGANRVERGERFVATATAVAKELGVKLVWELSYVPGTGHNSTSMSRAAADLVYGAKK